MKGADYIITTLRVGQDKGRVSDERIALKHGVLGQETTGAGGFAMALRSIPALLEYCQAIKDHANKEALIFNSPIHQVGDAGAQVCGFDNVYGICDGPSEFISEMQEMFRVGPERFSVECFGLNHLSWFRNIKVGWG